MIIFDSESRWSVTTATTHWIPADVRTFLCFVLFVINSKKMSHFFLRSSLHFLRSSAAITVDKMYHCSGAHKNQQNLSRKKRNVAVCFSSRAE